MLRTTFRTAILELVSVAIPILFVGAPVLLLLLLVLTRGRSLRVQDRNDTHFLQLQPHVTELRASHKLDEDILHLHRVVRQRRVIVNVRNRQPRGTEETHCGHLTGNSVELGDRDGIRDAGHHLEAVMHGDKESLVEAALGELHKCVYISRSPTNRSRCKSTKYDGAAANRSQ